MKGVSRIEGATTIGTAGAWFPFFIEQLNRTNCTPHKDVQINLQRFKYLQKYTYYEFFTLVADTRLDVIKSTKPRVKTDSSPSVNLTYQCYGLFSKGTCAHDQQCQTSGLLDSMLTRFDFGL